MTYYLLKEPGRLPRMAVSLRLAARDLDPDEVTRRLGLEPSRSWRRGDPVGSSGGRKHFSGWALTVGPREALDLCDLLDELRSVLTIDPELVSRTRDALGVDAAIYCTAEPRSTTMPSLKFGRTSWNG